jgi:hypothetical protein
LYIVNTTISENGTSGSGGGILIQPTGGTGSARVHFDNVRVINNATQGLRVDLSNASPNGVVVAIDESAFVNNGNGIILNVPAATTAGRIMLVGSTVFNNTGTGISAVGGTAFMRVGSSTITSNGTGVSASGGAIINSYGTNRLDANSTDGTFTAPITPEK